MKNLNYKAINRLVVILTFLGILATLYLLNLLESMKSVFFALSPFYIAFIIIWIMKPFEHYLIEKRKIAQKKAAIYAILVNLIIVLSIIFLLVPSLAIQIWDITQNSTQLIESITYNIDQFTKTFRLNEIDYINEVIIKVQSLLNMQSITEFISTFDFSIITNALGSIVSAVGSVTSFILQFVFAYIIAIYLAPDFDQFVEKTLNLVFSNTKNHNKEIFLQSTHALSGYFKGLIIVCVFVGTIVTLGAWLIGVPSPLLFGIIAGLFNVIPYLGPVLGGIPLVIVAIANGLPSALLALALVLVTQFIESQILQPRIMSNSTNLHPVTIIVGLIIFGNLFGFVGMILSTPTLAVISVIIKNSRLDIRI